MGENDAEILKALLRTGNHLADYELERAMHLNNYQETNLKGEKIMGYYDELKETRKKLKKITNKK